MLESNLSHFKDRQKANLAEVWNKYLTKKKRRKEEKKKRRKKKRRKKKKLKKKDKKEKVKTEIGD